MGLEERVAALTDVVLTVATAVAARDPEAAEDIGNGLRRMLTERIAEREGFTVAFVFLDRFEHDVKAMA